ncbi:MAG: TetR/AcrR family transcriptional regulator [Deltaproteobacteria bacterium]|jgi:TetR/AcrR family transcriptional regulator, transcriptional repressor for nem operon|nr:TetR/AcrR family transcriptional regulator [Deltaproteobacteria bacterium]MBT4265247.1 TetR/AcrR family transcriptional regulator [Deltaproteobacteria bacterium]MBT4639597.1 TetR/AcrR family transcriptional regulator [Deltaproteobacteria bacterium]MBT6502617.1 TetR/AcrR family transcriptional regulator [Deltaproteobacteria bacterium]MBT6615978.1 TetR/AcrR family transcriptional regulator [Deltaproteobacteria bacterium]
MSKKGTQTRQKIVEKSLQLFSIKGYYNTSVNDILIATQLTKGGLYGHFPSKEEIWYAVYAEAVKIWRSLVFSGIKDNSSPVARIEQIIENDIRNYLGGDVFEGGCFFLNMLVELSGQSASMSKPILRGFVRFSRLMRKWLEEADRHGLLKPGLNYRDIANFIVISLNGAAALYTSSRDRDILNQTIGQLSFYLKQLKK